LLVSEGVEERIGRLVLASCEAFDNYPPGILGRACAGGKPTRRALPGLPALAGAPLLPKELPRLPEWGVTAYYPPARGRRRYLRLHRTARRPARLVIDDVTDKGISTALVMATTHSILRSDAQGETSPGEVLERANERLYPDIPPHMFVTSLRGAEPR
jgi:hypothetical protein